MSNGVMAITLASLIAQTPLDTTVARFYERWGTRLAWGHSQTIELLDILAHAKSEGLDPADYQMPAVTSAGSFDSALTSLFFRYAHDMAGGRVPPQAADSQWTAAPPDVRDIVAVLEDALDSGRVADALQALAPSEPGYAGLRVALARYRALAGRGNWPAPLGQRLAAEGYDTTAGMGAALRRFQSLHGLEPDGIVGPDTRAQLDVPAADRARQIALNLERWRWLPRSLGSRYIAVNSAAFSLEVIDSGAVVLAMRAIVGRLDWPTPITSALATDIVFRPRWWVPRTIAVQELLPLVQRDTAYLRRQGFRVFADAPLGHREIDAAAIDWTRVTDSTLAYHFVQEPGPENPLGGMKLVFWNPFGVFIHDTPLRPPFSERWRAFSHGCVRIENAAALAAQLLPLWSGDSIRTAMVEGREWRVRLPQPIPVHLVYWTAWATNDGPAAFVPDTYGWDEALARALTARRTREIAIDREAVP